MATTVSIKQLANGQLAAAIGDIYASPALTQTIIKSIILVNTNSSTETVNLYMLKFGGVARRLVPKNLQVAAGYEVVVDEVITLEAGDKIQGDTTTAVKVDYTISGVQEA